MCALLGHRATHQEDEKHHERREQFHVLRLNEKLDALYPAVHQWFERGSEFFMHGNGDPVLSHQMALRSLQEIRDRQALALAYFDVFWTSAVVSALMVPFEPDPAAAKSAALRYRPQRHWLGVALRFSRRNSISRP